MPASFDDESGAPGFSEELEESTRRSGAQATLVPTRFADLAGSASGAPESVYSVDQNAPAPVYLATGRGHEKAASPLEGKRVLAVFLGSMGLTTSVILAGYGALLLAGGGLRNSMEPILVQTPIPFAVTQEVPVPVPMPAEEPEPEPVVAAAPSRVSAAPTLAEVGYGGSTDEPEIEVPPTPPTVTKSAVIVEPAEDEGMDADDEVATAPPAPRAEPEGVADAAPAPGVPHPLDGAYGGKAEGEAIQFNLKFRSDGTVDAEIVRPGGQRSTATGTFQNRRGTSVSFILVEGSGRDRITYSGSASDGRANGRIIQAGRAQGRFSLAQ